MPETVVGVGAVLSVMKIIDVWEDLMCDKFCTPGDPNPPPNTKTKGTLTSFRAETQTIVVLKNQSSLLFENEEE